MSKVWKVGVIGFAHMHVNGLIGNFNDIPEVEWVACADTKPAVKSISDQFDTRTDNIKKALEVTKIPKYYDCYEEMLEKEQNNIDIIIACPENARHGEVAEKIAEKKIHMLFEKPMSSTFNDALRMTKAAGFHGAELAINWPSTWWAAVRTAHKLVEAGEIGRVLKFYYRNSSSMGPLEYGQTLTPYEKSKEWWHRESEGGGAMLDYCCYGSCLARWFMGKPAVAASGMRANLNSIYGDADDNGIITAQFPGGLATIEGSWTIFHTAVNNGPVVFGDKGTLICEWDKVLVFKERNGPATEYAAEPIPEHRNNPAKEFINYLASGKKEQMHITMQPEFNLEAMAILDAGIRSAKSGRLEPAQSVHYSPKP
jgi:predicted dehydrogenase